MNEPFDSMEVGQFRYSIRAEFDLYLEQESMRFPKEECLKIDLHCHDHNSDVSDELWGRILRLPETWLKTKKLVKVLHQNGCDVVTITNHNNARSCWELIDDGADVLVAGEFTCHFPEYELFIHILTYGFTQEQEEVLNEKRKDIYAFLRYAAEQNIPVVLPHPLYFYTPNEKIDLTLFEKLAVMFQRFEVLNGQRDLWQSVLTLNWLQSLTPEMIDGYANKHNLNPADFGVDPGKPKILTGGSDDHTGIFAGGCGSYLYVPDLQRRLQTEKPSVLALEALREGRVSPYGHVGENQKLNIALLDYFSQAATKIEDPGLLRVVLHRGSAKDKIGCLIISNLLLEMQKNKHIQMFFKFVHDALQGKKPNKLLKWKVNKDYRFCIDYLYRIADSQKGPAEKYVETVNQVISELFTDLCRLIVKRVKDRKIVSEQHRLETFSTEELTRKFEMPSQLTTLFFGVTKNSSGKNGFNVGQLLDSLSFPVLICGVLVGAMFASTRVLYSNRQLLNDFATHIGKGHHQKRALYLTDTLRDKNGVSNSLSGKLKEIQRYDLPVDFLICHDSVPEEPHLHVVRPLTSVSLPELSEQEIRFPDLLEIAQVFYEGGYDRIVCSTEGPMMGVALILKQMFNVPGFFFMHTDWMDFIKHTTDLNHHERDRVRRLLRWIYQQFEGVFVLNSEHRDWLTSMEMELDPLKVHMTAHHVLPCDTSVPAINKAELFPEATEETPILFIASRLSKEKGILDLPEIIAHAKETLPDLRVVVAGSGPAERMLKKLMPEAKYLGWVDKQTLSQLYTGLDLFVFPSRFDTFGNVILEAFNHGMPAVSYDCKGPRDIIEQGKSGYLVETKKQFAQAIITHFTSTNRLQMKKEAIDRAAMYQAEPIMTRFLTDMGLLKAQPGTESHTAAQRAQSI